MENFVFYSPTKFIFGINEEENVGKYIKYFAHFRIYIMFVFIEHIIHEIIRLPLFRPHGF